MNLLKTVTLAFCRHGKIIIMLFVLFLIFYVIIFIVILLAISKFNDAEKVLLSTKMRNILSSEDLNFSSNSADNVTGFRFPIVPNVVHYVRFRHLDINFVEMLSIKSAIINHRPDQVIIHCDPCDHKGKYWKRLINETKHLVPIHFSEFPEPTHIFGKQLSSVYHASDIARIRILMQYGGIFLDGDVYVVKSLKTFLHFELSLGWPLEDNLGTQVIIAHKNARFLQLWLDSYRHYKPFMWYYNAGQLPTEDILMKQPHLVHRVPELFGVHYLIDELYKQNWDRWKEFYTIHLLNRHRAYLDDDSPVSIFNEHNIKRYPYTFGQMARLLMYNTTKIIK